MNSTTRKIGAAFGLAAVATFAIALPASAATTKAWGVWADNETNGQYLLSFPNTEFPGAHVEVYDQEGADYYSPDGEDEGFGADTPVGELIGANDTSTDYLFLKVETIDDNTDCATVEITFDSEVPADQLVVAVSDVDSDNNTITMTDAEDAPLTATEMIGSATTTGFNWDDMSNTDDTPEVVDTDPNTIMIGNAPDNTDGSTGWIRPSAPVKFISMFICTEDGNYSSERIWIGQIAESTDDSLAHTGTSNSFYLAAVAGGAMLAIGGLVGLRRRQA